MTFTIRRLAALLALLAVAFALRADIILFKDGLVLHGQMKQESTFELDPSGEGFRMPKGFMLLDDGPRRIYFPHSLVGDAVKKAPPSEETVTPDKKVVITAARSIPTILEVLETSPFDDNWDRTIRFRTTYGQHAPVNQHIGLVTPYLTRMDGFPRFAWSAYYLTREFQPETVQQLLAGNSKFKITKDTKPEQALARRFKYCDFFAQAGWFDEADAELARLLNDFPDKKESIEGAISAVGRMKTREQFEELKHLQFAGLHETARKRADAFPEARAAEDVAAAFREFKSEQRATAERLGRLAKHYDELKKLVEPTSAQFAKMAATLKTELNADGISRLEAFLGQADQAQRQRQLGRNPDLNPVQLLSLAATGWLLGNSAAESKPDIALRIWKVRQFLLDYQRASDPARREQMLAAFQKERTAGATFDDFFQIIPNLPPPEAEENIANRNLELAVESAARRENKYLLRLPPEYHHNRPYPLLIVLHNSGEKPQRALDRWADAAGDNGYLVAAPDWQGPLGGGYTYSEREHGIVLDMLRDLRRRFNVDSDRVFVFGMGQGGYMAYDLGLSHPDQFAGIIPMAAGPEFFTERYFRNAQNLPFYVVNGDRAGDSNANIRKQFNHWIQRGYPTIWVQYKGRGAEWFVGEIPNIFDWMRNKRRAFPLQQLGTDGNGTVHGNEFTMMRQGDNRFYWLSAENINDRCCTSVDRWVNVTPASMTARIDTEANEIYVRTLGVKQLRIWLGRSGKGKNMIDFDKPLIVRVNLQPRFNRKVAPSLAVMLEDLVQRGDRQQLFLAKLDFNQ